LCALAEDAGERQVVLTMKELNEVTVGLLSTPPRQRDTPAACIDLDRFCEGCGYNLRTLEVRREAHTGIPVVRCPECGRFQSANDASSALRPWLNRATALVLWVWILAVLAGLFFLGLGEWGVSYATLDELTVHGGHSTQRINNTTIRTWSSIGPLEVDPDYRDYQLFITTILISSFVIALVSGLFVVVVFPHWRRAAYVGLMLVFPVVAGGLVAGSWSYQAPHLFGWGLPYVAAHVGVQLLGGLAGITFGRALARLLVRILLPSSVRPRLAYLWLADGKPLPRPCRPPGVGH